MFLQVYIYQCKNCKYKFEEGELMGEPYGEFLLRNSHGDMVYLNAIEGDVVFEEVSQLLDESYLMQSFDDINKARILHKIYGVVCDVDTNQLMYNMESNPICPICKSNKMDSWQPVDPPRLIEKNINAVTYASWNNKNICEKKELLDKAIKSLPRFE